LQLLANATNDAIYDWDLVTNALTWNEGFWTMFGYSRTEVEPTMNAFNQLVHPEDEERTTQEMRRALARRDQTWPESTECGGRMGPTPSCSTAGTSSGTSPVVRPG